jgi:hypothetical protein
MDDHENMNNRHRLAGDERRDDEHLYLGFYYSNTRLGSLAHAHMHGATHVTTKQGVVYPNKLPLNHDITIRPAVQERRFIGDIAKQCLIYMHGCD